MRSFWPPSEAAQADYEALRAGVLAGAPLAEATAIRFARGGLAALLAHPISEPEFIAALHGAPRPAWTPHPIPAWTRSPPATACCWQPPTNCPLPGRCNDDDAQRRPQVSRNPVTRRQRDDRPATETARTPSDAPWRDDDATVAADQLPATGAVQR